MTSKAPRWSPVAPTPGPAAALARHAAAGALRSASAALARLARRLAARSAAPGPDPRLEFYAEAGAPEGALYLDGELVGWLPGVTRL
ncbi:hypothetical protein [Piscinibacter sp.]|uniref:hypothetical protein n=1 Tax=Piscinibacter sp. TaxID=1903157 RepID=UPI0039E51AEB